jgi:hypothetical protein
MLKGRENGIRTNGVEKAIDRQNFLLACPNVVDAKTGEQVSIAETFGGDRIPEDSLRSPGRYAMREW